MDIVRLDRHADKTADLRRTGALDHDLIAPRLHGDLVVDPLEYDGNNAAADLAFGRLGQHDILRTQDRGDPGAGRDVVDALELAARKSGAQRTGHDPVEDVAVADEVRHERILRFVVDIFRRTDLLDLALRHDDDLVRHGQRFFLIVCDIDERDAQFIVHFFQFELHLFAHLKIERAERLVEQQDLRLVHQRAGDGDALLLADSQTPPGLPVPAPF